MNRIEIIKELVFLLHLTPSGDNCRPFLFQFNKDSNEFKIIYCKKQATHVLNPNELSSSISLGMMDYAISILGLKIIKKEINFLELNYDQGVVACYWFDFDNSTILPTVKNSILNRKTNRSKHSEKVRASTDDKIVLIKDFPKELIQHFLKIEDTFWTNEAILRDVFHWVHLSKKHFYKKILGLYWRELGGGITDYPFFILLKYFRKWAILLYRLGVKFIIKAHLTALYESSSLLLIPLPSQEITVESFFELGRISYKKWLEMTDAGLVLQPLSFYTFSQIGYANDLIDELNQLTGQQNNFYWIFRAGKSNLKADTNIKLSKSIEQILSII